MIVPIRIENPEYRTNQKVNKTPSVHEELSRIFLTHTDREAEADGIRFGRFRDSLEADLKAFPNSLRNSTFWRPSLLPARGEEAFTIVFSPAPTCDLDRYQQEWNGLLKYYQDNHLKVGWLVETGDSRVEAVIVRPEFTFRLISPEKLPADTKLPPFIRINSQIS